MDVIQTILIKNIEEGLNNISSNYKFKFYNSLGDFEDAIRKGNQAISYVQGISRFLPTTLIPLQNVKMFRTTSELEIVVNVDMVYKDADGNYANVLEILQTVNNYCQTNQAKPYYQTIDETLYQIIPFFTLPTNDTVSMQSSDSGEVIPINFSIDFLVTANLVSADSYHLFYDGQEINFETFVPSRVRVADQYSTNGESHTETITLQGGVGFDLTLPQFLNATGDVITNDIFKGENNTAHYIRIERPNSTGTVIENYIMILGNTQGTMQKASNTGLNISLVEGLTYALNYDNSWHFETIDSYIKSYTVTQPTVFFWGDGTSNYVSHPGTITHEYPDIAKWDIIYKISN